MCRGPSAHVDGGDVGGRGHEVDHSVEHRLNALVLERGAADHGEEVHVDGALADEADERRLVGRLALQELLDPVVVLLHRALHHDLVPLLHTSAELSVLNCRGGRLENRCNNSELFYTGADQ